VTIRHKKKTIKSTAEEKRKQTAIWETDKGEKGGFCSKGREMAQVWRMKEKRLWKMA